MSEQNDVTSVTVTLVQPPPLPPPPKYVELHAKLTLREAAILAAVIGATNGSALTQLWGELSGNGAIDRERLRITKHHPGFGVLDVHSLEKQP